jgi:hypothetical protein
MPRVRPLHQLSLFIAIPIPFLDFADKSVVNAFDLLQVIIGKLTPLLFQFTFELHPFPLELIRVHDASLLCEIALSQCSYRSVSLIISTPPFLLAIMVTSPAAAWSKLLREQKNDPVATWLCLRATLTSQKGAALCRTRVRR